ncbi:MAG: hypothetical protein M1814_004474 [Vezdaea aestivalis]|nr:MAG: hypothetical protein M1814_004474 [Vezdaea aestivalis]
MASLPVLGHALRDQFLFDDGFVNLNHGSFGTYPKVVRDRFRAFQDQTEKQPDRFLRYEHINFLDAARERISQLVNCATDETVIVPNATTAVNVVLRNLRFSKGDKIIYFSTIYGACGKTVSYICETTPAEAEEVTIKYPMSDHELTQRFRDVVSKIKTAGENPKVAIFDTVASMPGVRMPYEILTKICRDEGVLSLIDGAHGIGHIPLDLEKLQPDFLTSNCHKWLFVPRGCAVLYVPFRNQSMIRSSLPTSHGFMPVSARLGNAAPFPPSSKPSFVTLFEFVGTLDAAPYFCIPTALAFRQSLGGEARIMEYCSNLARNGGKEIARILGTEVLENEEGTLGKCCMANIRLPLEIGMERGQIHPENAATVHELIQKRIMSNYPTFIVVFFDGDTWWTRVSGQVYLELSDMTWAAEILRKVCNEVNTTAGLQHVMFEIRGHDFTIGDIINTRTRYLIAHVGSINLALIASSRSIHYKLNTLITSFLPLALPPHTSNPSTYSDGLAYFYFLYFSVEKFWLSALSQTPLGQSCPFQEDVPFDLKHDQDSRPLILCPRLHVIFSKLYQANLIRTASLAADVTQYSTDPDWLSVLPVHAQAKIVWERLNAKPHVLVAYLWILYMALFSGGRFIRRQLLGAGPAFWKVDVDQLEGCQSGSKYIPVSFLRFSEESDDGEAMKLRFKERIKEVTPDLTAEEKSDILEEAEWMFSLLLDTVRDAQQHVPSYSRIGHLIARYHYLWAYRRASEMKIEPRRELDEYAGRQARLRVKTPSWRFQSLLSTAVCIGLCAWVWAFYPV